jgi:Flp pilus assembly secretin CpaC
MPGLRAATAALTLGALAALPAAALDLTVEIDHAHAVRLSEPAAAVIVGNPVIADVTPHDAGLFLITGKNFGATNVIALDEDGRQIYEADINVVGSPQGRLTVHRGLGRESYACHGGCERVPVPGDSVESFDSAVDARTKTLQLANSEAEPK